MSTDKTPVSVATSVQIDAAILNDRLTSMERILNNAKALNGGFDRLMADVETIRDEQAELKDTLYDPDAGVFVRIAAVDHKVGLLQHDVTSVKDICDNLPAFEANEIVQFRAQRVEHAAILRWQHNASKLMWLIMAAAMTGFAKLVFDFGSMIINFAVK